MVRILDRKYWHARRLFTNLLATKDVKLARRYLDQLEQHLTPQVEQVLMANHVPAGSVKERAQRNLYRRLSEFHEQGEPLPNLESLVQAVAYESLAQHLNEQNPRRRRLQLLVHYVLRNRADLFILSKNASGLLLAGVQLARRHTSSGRLSRLQANPVATATPLRAGLELSAIDYLPQLLERLLSWVGHRVPFVHLVSIVASLNEVPDPQPLPVDERLLLAEKIEAVYLLRQLWEALQALPPRQRLILLLGVQDDSGQSLLLLLSHFGIVSEAELATALEIGPRSFPLLLRELPCNDERLGELVKLTPEGIRLLRKDAMLRLGAPLNLWGQA